jgi:ATP-dependent DNA helicase RecG
MQHEVFMNAEELKLILEEGEGYRIEFKEALSGIDREMVAFANASGGRLFIGVTDQKAVRGMPQRREIHEIPTTRCVMP